MHVPISERRSDVFRPSGVNGKAAFVSPATHRAAEALARRGCPLLQEARVGWRAGAPDERCFRASRDAQLIASNLRLPAASFFREAGFSFPPRFPFSFASPAPPRPYSLPLLSLFLWQPCGHWRRASVYWREGRVAP